MGTSELLGSEDPIVLRFRASLRGLERLLGSSDRNYLIVQLYEGHDWSGCSSLEKLSYSILEILSPIVGRIDGSGGSGPDCHGETRTQTNIQRQGHAALQLVRLFRDKGEGTSCLELLNQVSNSSILEQDFERLCQIVHRPLLNLVHQATGCNGNKINRELLWIRLAPADVMRDHGEGDEALTLLSELAELENDDMDV
ncbi:uncharacterized protein Z518_05002 [Rhinocladiella mackenziei CBS 650.93]|uniref:Uncharacterized protein n=1 Tax=Rhinocladiella mackenziei CBS 650.93 TaxID=1442369 RepID=A0A0D2IV53_9EURO|nr:uncharacterized protein Z518_05002 [Rhinocladiella mackenziei CBS 650.93]KIX07026.1 hypothetical protein Z518_05002 [Rhinocladiella mackenziei CBS 650.93]